MPKATIESKITNAWYSGNWFVFLLFPLSWLFRGLIALRLLAYRKGWITRWRAPLPVVVVGNITVGGVGKTPLTIALVEHLKRAGFRPGIVSRGYGSHAPYYPYCVTDQTAVLAAGDEPLLIAQRTGCPMVISPDRVDACKTLLAQYTCDVVIADDGLQHYALDRDLELMVVDGKRGFGNGHCLPVGPLREPLQRIKSVDYCVVNGAEPTTIKLPTKLAAAMQFSEMALKPRFFANLVTGEKIIVDEWPHEKKIHAVAGIGNPERFFSSLKLLGFEVIKHVYPDHHDFIPEDIIFDGRPIIMTEKDAVKIRRFNFDNTWYLHVDAALERSFVEGFIDKVKQLQSSYRSAS